MKVEADVVTVREAALLVGRNRETVRRWVRGGELSSERRGRQHLISRSELEAVAARRGRPLPLSLAGWAKETRAALEATRARSLPSAADLILEDRDRDA
ncbi:MAG: helix-turn-helix domain-containing protein [Candidatus Dormiibacterota bacterium]